MFAAVFFIFANPTVMSLAVGAVIALAGLALRAWSSGHIRKASVLAVTGPYAHTRNPLYLGTLVMGVGFTIAAGVWWLALVFCVLFIGIYLPVMSVEAEDMRRIFPGDFPEFERNVPLLIPRLTPWRKSSEKFDIQLYFRYREYRAALGAFLAIGLLAAKALFFQ
ncbi:MAG TPA: isoprenylcysteine carboxylmethyltransferase family protein [Pyrinomonadaceae bacterium]|nr:isoprenylcysteine carboxylmethyltransferase family protein [Pyrinomonadaceae bacterium]